MKIQPVGLFYQHPLQWTLHHEPTAQIVHTCPKCGNEFGGEVRKVYNLYKEHVMDEHEDELEDCGCCGGLHFPEFRGDCREDWERF